MKPLPSGGHRCHETPGGWNRFPGVLDYPLLISRGYDPVTAIYAPDPDHPLLGYPVCRVAGCGREALAPGGIVLRLPGTASPPAVATSK